MTDSAHRSRHRFGAMMGWWTNREQTITCSFDRLMVCAIVTILCVAALPLNALPLNVLPLNVRLGGNASIGGFLAEGKGLFRWFGSDWDAFGHKPFKSGSLTFFWHVANALAKRPV